MFRYCKNASALRISHKRVCRTGVAQFQRVSGGGDRSNKVPVFSDGPASCALGSGLYYSWFSLSLSFFFFLSFIFFLSSILFLSFFLSSFLSLFLSFFVSLFVCLFVCLFVSLLCLYFCCLKLKCFCLYNYLHFLFEIL